MLLRRDDLQHHSYLHCYRLHARWEVVAGYLRLSLPTVSLSILWSKSKWEVLKFVLLQDLVYFMILNTNNVSRWCLLWTLAPISGHTSFVPVVISHALQLSIFHASFACGLRRVCLGHLLWHYWAHLQRLSDMFLALGGSRNSSKNLDLFGCVNPLEPRVFFDHLCFFWFFSVIMVFSVIIGRNENRFLLYLTV